MPAGKFKRISKAFDDARLIFIINANAMNFMVITHDCAVRWLATAGNNFPAGITKSKRRIKANTTGASGDQN
jgi:hypothetical protein